MWENSALGQASHKKGFDLNQALQDQLDFVWQRKQWRKAYEEGNEWEIVLEIV